MSSIVTAGVQKDVYVGPRPFETGEQLFGRDRETTALTSLLIGERVALLYAPSGAGKTSLIQAGLVPAVRDEEFLIPMVGPDPDRQRSREAAIVIRVNAPLNNVATADANRYLLSTLLSLEDHRPKPDRRAATVLAGMTLTKYLADEFPNQPAHADEPIRPLVLLFDQFEELLTLDPTDVAAKKAFMSQVGEALRETVGSGPRRWALFAMREDHIAGLEPYLAYFPTQLAARYRLDRLTPNMAREAIVGPARAAGISFDPVTADELVQDLTQVRVQQEDGSFITRPGPYVEPVHLQVVCRSLWEMTRSDPMKISAADLATLGRADGLDQKATVGGVDAVLGHYYATHVVAAAAAGAVGERRVRDWFEKELITVADARKPVQRGEEAKFNITRGCLTVLDKAYLVRSDARGGAVWYELAHDRLIAPIRRNNGQWRRDNLTDFQKRAEQWQDTGQPDQLLLTGRELSDAEQWANDRRWALSTTEQQFLTRSREQESQRATKAKAAQREAAAAARAVARYRKKVYAVAVACGSILLIGVLAAVFYGGTELEKERAKETIREAEQEQKARADKTIRDAEQEEKARSEAQAQLRGKLLQLQTNPPLEGAKTLEDAMAILQYAQDHKLDIGLAENAVRKATQAVAWQEIPTQGGPARATAYSSHAKRFAIGSDDGQIRIWEIDSGELPFGEPKYLPRLGEASRDGNAATRTVTALAFHPGQSHLVSGGEDGTIQIWALDQEKPLASYRLFSPVRRLTFSSKGKWLVSAQGDGTLQLLKWPPEGNFNEPLPKFEQLKLTNRQITSSMFTPNPRKLYAGSSDGTVWYWDTDREILTKPQPVKYISEQKDVTFDWAVSALAVTPDAKLFAVGTVGANVSVVAMEPGAKTPISKPREIGNFGVSSLTFSPDARGGNASKGWLAALTTDGRVKLWECRDFGLVSGNVALRGAEDIRAADLAFSPVVNEQSRWLLVGGIDGAARLWDLNNIQNVPAKLTGHTSAVINVGFSPNGCWAVTTSLDGRTRFWDLAVYGRGATAEPAIFSTDSVVRSLLGISPDGRRVTIATGNSVRIMDLNGRQSTHAVVASEKQVLAVAFDRTGEQLLTAGSDGDIVRWHVSPLPWVAVNRSRMPGPAPGANSTGCFAMNGEALLADQQGCLLNVGVAPRPLTLGNGFKTPDKLISAATGQYLVTFEKQEVTVWRIDPGKATLSSYRVLAFHDGEPTLEKVDVSPDGQFVAVGFIDGSVGYYPTAAKKGQRVRGHGQATSAVRFSADGSKLATGGGEGSIRLWDLKSGFDWSKSTTLSGHERAIRSLEFSADGNALLSVGADGTAKVWSVTVERLLERAKNLLQVR